MPVSLAVELCCMSRWSRGVAADGARGCAEVANRPRRAQNYGMAIADFALKLGLVLKTFNLSRGRLAQTVGVDKSVVSRWASGVQVPSDHNLSLLTEAVAHRRPGFERLDWDLDAEGFATKLDVLDAGASRLALPDKPSIAVLPFQNMSGDPEQAFFADGLTDDLITGLSRVSWLFVIARNSSFSFRGEKLDERTIGERLGVRYLVEGSVRRAGQRLRLTAQLVEAATGNHLWSDRYEGSLEDVFDFQDRIVVNFISAIEPKLRTTEIARARRKRTDSLDAFDLYLRAVSQAAAMSAESLAEAIELLDRAIGLSPDYAQALAYAALCRAARPLQDCSPDPDKDFREAAELSRLALAIDPADPLALTAAAYIPPVSSRDYQAGWDLIDRALAIDPNSAIAWNARGWISCWAGETAPAMAEFEKAMRLSPLDPQWGASTKLGMAVALLSSSRPDEALHWARRAVQETPLWNACRRVLIGALWLSGRHAEATEAAKTFVEMFPRSSSRRLRQSSPFRPTPGLRQFSDALREAGLPD